MNELVPMQEVMDLGAVLAKSGYFTDSRDAAQAVVKVLAGRELGFGPIASMTGVYIVKGKVALSANLMAAAIKRSGRYNYRVLHLGDDACRLEFYENGQALGVSEFTMADAKRAGLGGDNWTKYPRNMLFARALSNGAKWYCPDLSGGPLYTPDELGAVIDGDTGEVIDVEPVRSEQPAQAQPPTNGDKPWDDARKAKAIGWAMQNYPGTFKVKAHAENALAKLMRENPDLDNGELADAWMADVKRRFKEAQQQAQPEPVDGEEVPLFNEDE